MKMQYCATATASLKFTRLLPVVGHSTKHSIPFFFILTQHSNIVQPAAFELHSHIATASVISSLTKTSTVFTSTMNNAPPAQDPYMGGYILYLEVRGRQFIHALRTQNRSILSWLFWQTLLFLVAKTVSWAFGSYQEIGQWIVTAGIAARAYRRLPPGRYEGWEMSYHMAKRESPAVMYTIALHLAFNAFVNRRL